jgi:hypothetical protein
VPKVKTPSKAFSIAIAGPILAGKEEPWRRFLQELSGSRSREYGDLMQRLGIFAERVWLMRTRGSETAIAYFEARDPQQALARLVASEEPFDLWFKEKLREFHGCDLARLQKRWYPELVFALGGHEPCGTGGQA